MKTFEYYGTYPTHDPDNITWWESLELAYLVAEKRGHGVITRTKTTHDDPSDIDKPEAKFFGPLQINYQGGDNHQRNITPDSLAAFIENWRMTLPNRTGDNTTAEHILNNLENIYIK